MSYIAYRQNIYFTMELGDGGWHNLMSTTPAQVLWIAPKYYINEMCKEYDLDAINVESLQKINMSLYETVAIRVLPRRGTQAFTKLVKACAGKNVWITNEAMQGHLRIVEAYDLWRMSASPKSVRHMIWSTGVDVRGRPERKFMNHSKRT